MKEQTLTIGNSKVIIKNDSIKINASKINIEGQTIKA